MVFCKLLGSLVAFQELLFLVLALLDEGLWVEVGVVDCQRFVSPLFDVLVIERGLNRLVATLLPGVEHVGMRSVASCLELFDLITVVNCVVENLPFLGGSLVSSNLFILCASLAHNLFDPPLELDERLFHAGIIVHSVESTVVPPLIHLVVVVVVVMLTRSVVLTKKSHLLLLLVKALSQQVKVILVSSVEFRIHHLRLQFGLVLVQDGLVVRTFSRVVRIELGYSANVACSLSRIIIVKPLLDRSNVKLRLSEWSLPVVFVQVEMVVYVQGA